MKNFSLQKPLSRKWEDKHILEENLCRKILASGLLFKYIKYVYYSWNSTRKQTTGFRKGKRHEDTLSKKIHRLFVTILKEAQHHVIREFKLKQIEIILLHVH
jgi:hypothetical protein